MAVGAGTAMDTAYCYGQGPATLREKYREAHDLIVRAWTAKKIFSFNGKYTQLRYVNLSAPSRFSSLVLHGVDSGHFN